MLFQSSFLKYFLLLYLYIYLCGNFSCIYIYFYSLMSKRVWLWSLLPNVLFIFSMYTNLCCEYKTIYNIFAQRVGSRTCWVIELSCIKSVLTPVLSRDFHRICPWITSTIKIHSHLLTSFVAFCIFVLSSSFTLELWNTKPIVMVNVM